MRISLEAQSHHRRHIVPDRFFWALPPPEEGDIEEGGTPEPEPEDPGSKGAPRRVH